MTNLLITLALSSFAVQTVLGQNAKVGWSSLNAGGGVSDSGNAILTSSIGQSTAGVPLGSGARVTSGFLSYKHQTASLHLYDVRDKWNLISVPLALGDYLTTVVYPTAVSNAFYFDAGYFTSPTLENGKGYWLKFDSAQTVGMTGGERTLDTIDVIAGWNMIGTLSTPIPVAGVTSIPGGIVTSNFFQFTDTYVSSPTIEPGKGYWVKVTQAGKLVLSSTASVEPQNRIRIEDDGELPPAPATDGRRR